MMKLPVDEIARGLGIPAPTLERWIRQGRVPIQRIGLHCEFRLSALEKWAEKHHLRLRLARPVQAEKAKETRLWEAMQRGGVLYDLAGDDKADVLRHLVFQSDVIEAPKKESLLELLMERERLASTGVGKGVAFPHPRSPLEGLCRQGTIITAFLHRPVEYGAVDGRHVFAVFMLLSPAVQTHLHLLSRLSYCIRNDAFIDFLQTNPKGEALIDKVAEFESKLDSGETPPARAS